MFLHQVYGPLLHIYSFNWQISSNTLHFDTMLLCQDCTGRLSNDPKDIPNPNLLNLYLTQHGKRDFIDVMKKLSILTLNMGRFILDYPHGPNIIMRVLAWCEERGGGIRIEAEFREEGRWRKGP